MQLIVSANNYFVKSAASILTVSREDGSFSVIQHTDFGKEQSSLLALGAVDAVIGKLKVDEQVFLFLVVNSTKVAIREREQREIRRVDRAVAVCVTSKERADPALLEGTGNNHLDKLKNSQKKLIKFVSGKSSVVQPKIVDELLRLLNDNGDFYFESCGGDITKSVQRASTSEDNQPESQFFWNQQLLSELGDNHREWIVPVVQGFVAQRNLQIDELDMSGTDLTITLISRRSTRRAGARYLRRGIDDEANVANFVETEFVIDVFGHQLAFVQIRGSVPLYWSQNGHRYRPPLNIDREMKDSMEVFKEHFENLRKDYGAPIVAVNLVNQTGRELCLAQAYLEHVLELNSVTVGYFSFDFHHHCRALKFHKVNELMHSMREKLTEMGYCWIDKNSEVVLRQKGVVRTNCVDCLDRTNVVQGAICQFVAASQFKRLGLMSALTEEIPEVLQTTLQEIWADNGDAISRQYSGTDALKGDVTRSGQRKLVGLVKDGYSSASRYYLSHMRDAQRQMAIDAFISARVGEAAEQEPSEEDDDENEAENIGRLVHETVRFVLPEGEILVGGWALVDGDNRNDLVDSILLLTRTHVYIAQYEEQSDKLTGVTTIPFSQIVKMELGVLGKSPRRHLRIYWNPGNGAGALFDSWRAAKTRLFNNVAIPLKCGEEADEYVQAICEQLKVTISMCSKREIPVFGVGRLQGTASTPSRPIFSAIFNKTKRPLQNAQENTSKKAVVDYKKEDDVVRLKSPNMNQEMAHSRSDGLISAPQRGPNNSFVSKLSAKLLKSGPLWIKSTPDMSEDSPEAAVPPATLAVDPFQQYKDQILASKSLIQML